MSKSIMSPTQYDKDTVMIVDALNLAFRWKHSKTVHFSDLFVSTIDSLRKSYKAEHVLVVSDKGSSEYRKAIYPDYKGARKEKFENQTDEEKEEFELFFEEFSAALELAAEKYPVIRFDKCEADDIAAYLVKKLRKNKNIWLISSDRDWDLLVSDKVSRFSYVTRKEIREDNWSNFYDYAIEDHISIKCLTGDSGDSIPGVEGIGPVKAKNLIKEYGTAYDVAMSIPITSKYKYIAKLNEFGANNIIRNYRLMDIETHCEEALGVKNCQVLDNIIKELL